MEKIDRLGWVAGTSFVAYGLRIGIRVNDPSALDRVSDLLPYGWKPGRSAIVDHLYSLWLGGAGPRRNVRRFNLLHANAAGVARSLDLEAVFRALESDLEVYVAERARRRVFVHAGVVSWQGRAIVIPGSSFTGKTTLVAALLRAGATYYSDEYAVLDARGRVHPYLRSLSIREGSNGQSKRLPVKSLGGVSGNKPLPVGLIVFTEYKPGKKWRPRSLSTGRAALKLLAHTVPARRRPQRALASLRHVVAEAKALKSVRGEADGIVESLLRHCGTKKSRS